MLILVTGGAGSGKSEFAEGLIAACPITRRCYLATMQVGDGESRLRVQRHRAQRAGKGFVTLECPARLAEHMGQVPEAGAVLLEDLSNLTANEYFGPDGACGAARRVLDGVAAVCTRAQLTVVVANELFSDGLDFADQTGEYLSCLARVGREIASMADEVYEVVCGIPVRWKGGEA